MKNHEGTKGTDGAADNGRASAIMQDILDNHLPRVMEGLRAGYVDENQLLVAYDHAVRARVLRETASSSMDALLAELSCWQLATFPDESPRQVYDHLREELQELGADLSDRGELADCLMLVLCLCFKQGIDPVAAIRTKHEVNLRRRWEKTERGYRHTDRGEQEVTE